MMRQILIIISIFLAAASGVLQTYADRGNSSNFDTLLRLSAEELARVGEDAFRAGDYERANEAFSIMKSQYKEEMDKPHQRLFARSFILHGNSLYEQGAYSTAMEALLSARRIAERNKWNDIHAQTLALIGNLYASNYDYETATVFYRTSLSLIEPLPQDSMKNLRASVLNNLTGTYAMRSMADSARIFARRFDLLGDMPDKRHNYDRQLTKALAEDAASNHTLARKLYRLAISAAETNNLEPIYAAAVYSCLASSFEKTATLDSATKYMKLAVDVAQYEGYMNEHIGAMRDLARIYEKRGEKDSAMFCRMRYLELADSLRFTEEQNKLRTSEMLYTIDSNASTIKGLNAIRAIQWRWLIALSIFLLIVVILLIIVSRQKRALSEAWKSLYERNRRQMEDQKSFANNIRSLEHKLSDAEERLKQFEELSSDNTINGMDKEELEIQTSDTRSLSINDDLKKMLARKIQNVMENTDLFCQPDFSLERLASEVGSNTRYVSEVVNDNLGVSFRSLLNECRVKRAMQMLADTENYGHLTIKAIGESVGYKSASTFINVFTKQTGLKPSLYQKLSQEKRDNPDKN